ncbi:hypothetical protein GB937_000188 [Aspergillus fischeri]|nr:hypothetical protein GB937_000188 [Aspergillus fischeri]
MTTSTLLNQIISTSALPPTNHNLLPQHPNIHVHFHVHVHGNIAIFLLTGSHPQSRSLWPQIWYHVSGAGML